MQNFKFFEKSIFRFLIISLATFDLQERTIPQIKAKHIYFWPYFVSFFGYNPYFMRYKATKLFYFLWHKQYEHKKLQNWTLFEISTFRFFIIALIIFDQYECTVPQIKDKDISFWPYFLRFLAKINTLRDKR